MADIVGNKTVRDIWEDLSVRRAEHTFLIFESCEGEVSEFNYSDFNKMINKAANMFKNLGVRKGDLIASHMHNSPEFLAVLFAASKLGVVLVPLNYQYRAAELNHIYEMCDISIAVIDEEFHPLYLQLHEHMGVPIPKLIIARTDSDYDNCLNFNRELGNCSDILKNLVDLSSDDTLEILFTSGTTSHPKGVIITNCNAVYAGIYHSHQCDLAIDERFFTTMPGCHIDFQLMATMAVLHKGATLVVAEKFSASKYWKQVCEYKANVIDTMPMLIRTTLMQEVHPWERDHCVHHAYFSMGMSNEEREEFVDRFNVRFINCYGMTETVCCNTGTPLHGDDNWPSVGKPGLSYEIFIVDENKEELPPYSVGEIVVKGVPGRTLSKGYYKDPEATARLLCGDRLYTGDRGYLTQEGWLYFEDRRANMIKRSGENISSLEVENVLASCDDIQESAVIGVDDPLRNQAVKAFVMLCPGSSMTIEQISEYCCERLASFKVPTIIEIVDEFPRTSNGKIRKNLLK